VLKGFDTIYVPNNPILHMVRGESLSRTKDYDRVKKELEVMKSLYRGLLLKHRIKT